MSSGWMGEHTCEAAGWERECEYFPNVASQSGCGTVSEGGIRKRGGRRTPEVPSSGLWRPGGGSVSLIGVCLEVIWSLKLRHIKFFIK